MNKAKRHFAIKEIILSKAIPSQEELCVDLKKRGFDVTQATLSRDLKELGVDRVHSEDGMRYVLSTEGEERKIKSLIGFEITSINANEAMIVIRTLPGRSAGRRVVPRLASPSAYARNRRGRRHCCRATVDHQENSFNAARH